MSRFVALALLVLVAGCGGSSNNNSSDTNTSDTSDTGENTTPSSTPATSGAGDVTVRMSEFKFDPNAVTVKAGKVTISAPNDGNVAHELVLLKTDADPAKLPMKGGEVDESSSVGEIPDVASGATKSHTFTLKPGKYAMVCNLPGHYSGGMYGSLTVQ